MKALIRKSDEPRPATATELERLRALRRIVIYQDDLDVIDRSIIRLEADADAGFRRRGASIGLSGQAGTLPT